MAEPKNPKILGEAFTLWIFGIHFGQKIQKPKPKTEKQYRIVLGIGDPPAPLLLLNPVVKRPLRDDFPVQNTI